MDLNLITTFVRVVERGSFVAAARSLRLPPSSVSRKVSRLEENIGVRLLERTTRKLTLTEAGRGFFERSRSALEDLDEVIAATRDQGRIATGRVRVTAPNDIGALLLAGPLVLFAQQHPSISIELSLSNQIVDLVAEGVDMALRLGELEDSSLVTRRVASFRGYILAAPSYLREHGSPRTPADLAAHHCILFRRGPMTEIWNLIGPEGTIKVPMQGLIEVDDMPFAFRAAVAGGGLVMLPSFAALRAIKHGILVRVLPEYHFPTVNIQLVMPSSRLPAARVVLFRDFLIDQMARLPREDGPLDG